MADMTNEELAYAAEMHAETNPACTEPMQGYLREIARRLRAMSPTPRPIDEWHEDMGDQLWWRFPIEEVPHCGTPNDSDFLHGFYTHFTPIPIPQPPEPTDD